MAQARGSKEGALYTALLRELEVPRNAVDADARIRAFLAEKVRDPAMAERLRMKAKREGLREVELRWPGRAPLRHIVSSKRHADPLAIAMAFFKDGYLCGFPALHWNGLSNQVPTSLYVAYERPSPAKGQPDPRIFDPETLRDEFMKPPPEPQKVALYGGHRFILLERAHAKLWGVIDREVMSKAGKVSIRLTGLERTLVDAAISPHHAGGIDTVADAFEAAASRLDLEQLRAAYDAVAPTYPHWQRLGLLLEKTKGEEAAEQWLAWFGAPKRVFYLAKGYKLSWRVNERWQVAHPEGLFP